MGDLAKNNTEITEPNLSNEKLKALLTVFPLAQIHPEIYKMVQRERTRDESFIQFMLLGEQLRKLRVVYEALQTHITGFKLAFPVAFKGEGIATLEIIWVVESDPCGLYDCVPVYAKTTWTEKQEAFSSSAKIDISTESSYSSRESKTLTRALAQLVSSKLFNEVFREFFKLAGIRVPCHNRDKDEKHINGCSVCHGEGEVLFYKVIRESFDAFEWLKMVAEIF